ncbi:PepSY domain containing protein [Burkholderia multivorans]
MTHLSLARLLALVAIAAAASTAFASPACTRAPESAWLSETAMRQKIAAMGYKDIKVFKKTRSGCYEIYGRTADGRKAEVYFNPVDGSIVEHNED